MRLAPVRCRHVPRGAVAGVVVVDGDAVRRGIIAGVISLGSTAVSRVTVASSDRIVEPGLDRAGRLVDGIEHVPIRIVRSRGSPPRARVTGGCTAGG